jgi:C1A family cysteine protease
MARQYPLKREKENERDFKYASSESELPESIDLREFCPPVFDQGELGSCTANAGTAAYMMLKKINTEHSRLYLYYEERRLEGTTDEDAGASMRSVGMALNKIGICTEELWPYIEKKFAEDPPNEADSDAINHRITAYKKLLSSTAIKHYLAEKHGPVLIGMEVYESFEHISRDGFVPMPDTSDELLLGGHAVLVVGYDDNLKKQNKAWNLLKKIVKIFTGSNGNTEENTGYFIVLNSWGTDWGDKGYFYLPYTFMEKHAFDFWVLE